MVAYYSVNLLFIICWVLLHQLVPVPAFFLSPDPRATIRRSDGFPRSMETPPLALSSSSTNTNGNIEYQCDTSKYGRGEMHLSAMLDVGDVVVYQTGTWLVDGVEVGDGGPVDFQYGRVETIQLVWTHNCEHGVIRALPLELVGDSEKDTSRVLRLESEDCLEFGPEQLVAKLSLDWDESAEQATSPFPLVKELWIQEEDDEQ